MGVRCLQPHATASLLLQVIPYSLSYACLKSVNYALFFWLPFYLTVSLNMDNSKAGVFSVRMRLLALRSLFASASRYDLVGR